MISWDVTKEESSLIQKVTDRAFPQVRGVYHTKSDLIMDITAVHANGNPLKLKDMIEGPDFDFYHDIIGIAQHLDRTTGKLKNFFVPRYLYSRRAHG